ncbi:MAG TPA: ATP synthase F0 subunit B [Candidatus Saccharicenans sp.]|nr:ATP synthase F0 subunit B [Candidatus Saccharicenans sp.]
MKYRPTRSPGILVIFILIILSVPGQLLAAEAGEGFDLSLFLGQVVNFVLLFGGLAYLLYKPLIKYLQHKSDRVAENLKKSEEQRVISLRRLEESKERLSKLDEEIDRLKKEAEIEASKERERIALEARAEADRLKKLAREEINSLVKISQRELEVYTLDLSISLAEQRIREKLGPELHRKIINKAIEELGTLDESTISN